LWGDHPEHIFRHASPYPQCFSTSCSVSFGTAHPRLRRSFCSGSRDEDGLASSRRAFSRPLSGAAGNVIFWSFWLTLIGSSSSASRSLVLCLGHVDERRVSPSMAGLSSAGKHAAIRKEFGGRLTDTFRPGPENLEQAASTGSLFKGWRRAGLSRTSPSGSIEQQDEDAQLFRGATPAQKPPCCRQADARHAPPRRVLKNSYSGTRSNHGATRVLFEVRQV